MFMRSSGDSPSRTAALPDFNINAAAWEIARREYG
jgi:hypothetical protein